MKTIAFSIHLGSAALAAGLLLASSPARAQDAVASGAPLATSEPAQRISQRISAFERNRVYHSRDDGTPWVRGATYKARFGVEGVSYAPYLGSGSAAQLPGPVPHRERLDRRRAGRIRRRRCGAALRVTRFATSAAV